MNIPHGLEAIKEFYDARTFLPNGVVTSPAGWVATYIVLAQLPASIKSDFSPTGVSHVPLHRNIRAYFVDVMTLLKRDYPESYERLRYSGSFNPRMKRGLYEPSMHGLGAAIDFNASDFPMNRNHDPAETDMPTWFQHVIHCFRSEGWKWGGDFGDTMHFQFGDGY